MNAQNRKKIDLKSFVFWRIVLLIFAVFDIPDLCQHSYIYIYFFYFFDISLKKICDWQNACFTFQTDIKRLNYVNFIDRNNNIFQNDLNLSTPLF